MRNRLTAPLLALAASALTGCAAAAQSEPVQPATRAAMVDLIRQPNDLAWAESKATAVCMGKAGFDYPPYLSFRPQESDSPGRLGGLGVPLNIGDAEATGYGSLIPRRDSPDLATPDQAEHAYLKALTPADRRRYGEALEPADATSTSIKLSNGTRISAAESGCLAEGRAAVYGSVQAFLRATNFVNETFGYGEEVFGAGPVKSALASYASCMRRTGIDVATPGQAVRLASERFGMTRRLTDPVSDAERGMAIQDATCQARSEVNEAIDNAFVDAASTWINDHEAQIVALADAQDASLRRAHDVLAGTLPAG